jgi:hypothetical protein
MRLNPLALVACRFFGAPAEWFPRPVTIRGFEALPRWDLREDCDTIVAINRDSVSALGNSQAKP